jgi:Protein of unknown function (DUF3253)
MTAPDEPERTPDGRYLVIDGRRWRASDPAIPAAFRAELVAELMAARRAVQHAGEQDVRAARDRVQDAKVALGERGDPWWEPTGPGRRERVAATVRTLLRHRDPDRTICPSDVARTVGGDGWRAVLPLARAVAADLADQGVIEVRQRGAPVDLATAKGPVRLARGARWV